MECGTSQLSDDNKERFLSILSLEEQHVKSPFDEKENEAKDGLLCLFDDEEGFLWILPLKAYLEMQFCESGGTGRMSHPLLI